MLYVLCTVKARKVNKNVSQRICQFHYHFTLLTTKHEGSVHSCFSITLHVDMKSSRKQKLLKLLLYILSSATKDKLNAENEDLKKKHKSLCDEKETLTQQLSEVEMRVKLLNSQYEGKITKLEKELQDSQVEKEQNGKLAEDMKKQLEETQQKQKL